MAWTDPIDPVVLTVITKAYAVANFLGQIRWLRTLTGGADPPGSSYTIRSTSTTATDWSKVTEDMLQNGSVTADKLGNLAVGFAKLAQPAVTAVNIADANVTEPKLADDAVSTRTIANGAVTLAAMAADAVNQSVLAANSVGTAELIDSNVTLAKMADNSVGTAELVAASVTAAKLATSAAAGNLAANDVTATMLAADSVTTVKILNANVTGAKLSSTAVVDSLGYTPGSVNEGVSAASSGVVVTTSFATLTSGSVNAPSNGTYAVFAFASGNQLTGDGALSVSVGLAGSATGTAQQLTNAVNTFGTAIAMTIVSATAGQAFSVMGKKASGSGSSNMIGFVLALRLSS